MNKLSTVSAITLASFVTAAAAGEPPRSTTTSSPSRSDAWDGFYIGGNLGAGGLNTQQFSRAQVDQPDTNFGSYSGSGLVGGAQVGFDRRMGRIVLGAQTLWNWAGIHASTRWPGLETEVLSAKLRSFGSVTARAGYVLTPDVLAYAKGGLAIANFRYGDDCANPSICWINDARTFGVYSGVANKVRAGWLLGAGFEYAIDKKWSAFVEFDHAHFESKSSTLNYTVQVSSNNDWRFEHAHRINIGLFGLNYRL